MGEQCPAIMLVQEITPLRLPAALQATVLLLHFEDLPALHYPCLQLTPTAPRALQLSARGKPLTLDSTAGLALNSAFYFSRLLSMIFHLTYCSKNHKETSVVAKLIQS